ncbi:MAG: phosphodiester glycosidase family protein [Chitinophagaceae bacterium]
MFLAGCILFLTGAPFCFAQQLKWTRVDSAFGKLPASIKVYKTTDSLNGKPFIAYYLEARLKDRSLDFTTQTGDTKRYTPSEYYTKEDSPYVVVNGTFFSFETNQNLNLVVKDGELVAYNTPSIKSKLSDSFYYPTRAAIGITLSRKPDVAWTFTDSSEQFPYGFQYNPVIAKGRTASPRFKDLNTLEHWKWWRMQTAIGGGPVLLKDGEVYITNKEEQMFVNGEKDKHPRTAMGYTRKKKLIILVITGRYPGIAEGATLEEEALILKDLGCIEALNLDGGGSSCMLVNGKETIKPSSNGVQRPVPAVFIIRKRKARR